MKTDLMDLNMLWIIIMMVEHKLNAFTQLVLTPELIKINLHFPCQMDINQKN